MEESHKVIIIGAGISGLAAASQLVKHEEFNFVILEARDRSGGRVHTDEISLGHPLDMGASWISGERGNPIKQLANEFHAKVTPTEDAKTVVYDTNGKRLGSATLKKMNSEWNEFVKFMEQGQKKANIDVTLESKVNKFANSGTKFGKKLTKNKLTEFYYEIAWNIGDDWAADPSKLSDKYWDKIGYLLPGAQVVFPEGYSQLTKGLENNIGTRKFQFKHIVKKVQYNADGVTVSTDKDTFKGKYVICTLPLGVLQKNSVKFSKPLPKEKIKAIKRLGMGFFHKTYFKFSKPFWIKDKDKDKDWINYIPEKGKEGQWACFLNFHKLVKEPILLGLNFGKYASQLEKLSDDEVKNAGMKVIKTMFGKDAQEPVGILVSSWIKDPLAGGAYSYTPPDGDLRDYDILAEPVMVGTHPRVFFAGEATTKFNPATVHGAYISGIREANRLRAYDNNEFPPPEKQLIKEWELYPEYIICKAGSHLMVKKHTMPDGTLHFHSPICVNEKEREKYLNAGWTDQPISSIS
jgi:monoamine oxidase